MAASIGKKSDLRREILDALTRARGRVPLKKLFDDLRASGVEVSSGEVVDSLIGAAKDGLVALDKESAEVTEFGQKVMMTY